MVDATTVRVLDGGVGALHDAAVSAQARYGAGSSVTVAVSWVDDTGLAHRLAYTAGDDADGD